MTGDRAVGGSADERGDGPVVAEQVGAGAGASVAVIGAGVVGLRIAESLAAAGSRVTVFDPATEIGGLASASSLADADGETVATWDRYYHVVLPSDTRTRALLARLGLAGALRFGATRTAYFVDGTVYPASTAIDFLRLPGLDLLSKLRIGATVAVNARRPPSQRLDGVTAHDWLLRWSGRRGYEQFWRPQLVAKLGPRADRISAAFLHHTIRRLASARSSVAGRERLGWIAGGYARVLRVWTARVTGLGVQLRLGTAVVAVTSDDSTAVVATADDRRHEFDSVVVTAASPVAGALITPPPEGAAQPYLGIICVSVVLRTALAGAYVTYLAADLPMTAIIEMSALATVEGLDGRTLVYLPKYVTPDDPMFDCPDDEIVERFVAGLRAVHPHVTPDHIVATSVARARYVFVASVVGGGGLPPFTTASPRVFTCGSGHIHHGTLNVDESLGLADRFVDACGSAIARNGA